MSKDFKEINLNSISLETSDEIYWHMYVEWGDTTTRQYICRN